MERPACVAATAAGLYRAASPAWPWTGSPSWGKTPCVLCADRANRELYDIFSSELVRTGSAGLVAVLSSGLEVVDPPAQPGLVRTELWRPHDSSGPILSLAAGTESLWPPLTTPALRLLGPQRVGVVLEPVARVPEAALLGTSPFESPLVAAPPTDGLMEADQGHEALVPARSGGPRPSRRRKVRVFCRAALMGVVAVAGSTGAVANEPPPPLKMGSEAPPQSVPSGATPGAVVGSLGSGQPVRIALAGDIHFEGALAGKLSAGPLTVLAPVAPTLASADLAIANLETAVTERGTAQPKRYVFRAPASAFGALAAGGIDVVNLANNHGMDFGPVGLQDTLAAPRSAGVAVVGMGANAAEAYAPFRTTINGQRIAVIGATHVLDHHLVGSWSATEVQPGLASAKDVQRLVEEVAQTRVAVDTLVVFLHWGVEGQHCPTTAQVVLARRLVAAGADIVVGSHTHRLQGAGRMGDAFVAYGLGNFAFYSRGGPGAESGVLTVTATGRRIEGYSWEPFRIAGGVPRPVAAPRSTAMRQAWEGLRGCTGLER